MATKTKVQSKSFAPAESREEREDQLIRLAYDLVEQRMKEGTASSQETCHFLKLGCSKERLEKAKLEQEVKLAAAKTKSIESMEKTEQLYAEAIAAMRRYAGSVDEEEDDGEEI